MRLRSPLTVAATAALALLAGGGAALGQSGSGSASTTVQAANAKGGLSVGPPTAVCGPAVPAEAGTPPPPRHDPFKAAADYLGLSVDQLMNELQGGKSLAEVATARGKPVDGLKQVQLDAAKADLDQAVAAGHIKADEEQQLLSRLRSDLGDLVNQKGVFKGGPGGGPVKLALDPFKGAADYLGLSVDQLMQQLQEGKSLAEVATAHGKPVDGLKQAQLDGAKADLDQAVAAGDMTAGQEQELLGRLRSDVDDLVNQKGGLPGPPCGAAVGAAGLAVAPVTMG
jgi:hypothetical protein